MTSATASASLMEGSGARLLRSLWLERPIGYPECPTNVKRRKRRLPHLTCSTAPARRLATCGAGLVLIERGRRRCPSHMRQRPEDGAERAVRSSLAGAPPRERQVMMRKARRASAPTVATYRDDPLYPRIERAMTSILAKGKVVAPVDVLVDMGLLAPEKLEDWRRGRVHYLEAVIHCDLTRLSRILKILRFHAHDLKLVPSITAYMRRGKRPKQRLRFTKTGEPNLEEAYARHFVWPGKGPFHPPAPKETRG